MRQPSNKQRLEKLLRGSISSKLDDYYYIYVDPAMDIDDDDAGRLFVQKDGRDYYKIMLCMESDTFKKDEKRLNGIQARLLFAMFNSISSSRFDSYPSDTHVCVNNNLGYSAQLNDIFNLASYLDKTSSKEIKITSYPLPNGFAQFVAAMSGRGAVLSIHGRLPSDTIKGLLKPFLKADGIGMDEFLASYIRDDYDLSHKP
ncbi:MAG: hypothetical protein KJ955_02985 [Nanoarchaeota archaeon]|nr:hypothetical protein [Nanoarchaeota archaeon]